MKRIILACVCTAGLSLGATSTASAAPVPALQVESGVLGPGGSVVVLYSVNCVEGYQVFGGATVRQKAGRVFNTGGGSSSNVCSVTGTQTFKTAPIFGTGPFKKGQAVAEASVTVCDPTFDCTSESQVVEFTIAK